MEFPQGVNVTDGAAVGLRHQALAYRGSAECLASVLSFVRDGLRRDEAVSVGVGRPVTRLLRQALPDEEPRIAFTDMTELGRNPGRIIAAMSDFASRNAGRAVRFVTEPFWPTRSPAEVIEATRHEALVNRAFAGAPVTALCLYDAGALDPAVLLTAHQTHPVIVSDGQAQLSLGYATPAAIPPECERALPPPPPWASFLPYAGDLRPVRTLVARYATLAGLPAGRAADLVLAASEIAANTLRHTGGHGTLHVWRTPDEFICQLRDQGHIADPLAGRRRAAGLGGHGLWVVHQVCDLVELRTGPSGTVLRLHMRRLSRPSPGPSGVSKPTRSGGGRVRSRRLHGRQLVGWPPRVRLGNA
jgi:anti-sigma regulatory factor (Ser/Thr protein kinase)